MNEKAKALAARLLSIPRVQTATAKGGAIRAEFKPPWDPISNYYARRYATEAGFALRVEGNTLVCEEAEDGQ